MKDRITGWLMAHPSALSVLWLVFLAAAETSKHIPDGVSTQSGASSSLGP